jgi:hypothetical protein
VIGSRLFVTLDTAQKADDSSSDESGQDNKESSEEEN